MIMAGRGRRLGEPPKQVGSTVAPDETYYDLSTLIQKINNIHVADYKHAELTNIQTSFKRLCKTKNEMNNILQEFHKIALKDADFSDKLLLALSPIYYFEEGDVNFRRELLTLLQNDFECKDKLIETDKKSFLNSVMLLGSAFKRIKISETPATVLGVALLEYFDILMKGKEEDLKVLTTQVFINGENFLGNSKLEEGFNRLQCNLRNSLVSESLDSSSRYWILLCVDFISNGIKPLAGFLRDFYVEKLGNDYIQLESLVKATNNQLCNALSSPESVKDQESSSTKSCSSENSKKDLATRLSDINITASNESKRKVQPSFSKQKESRGWKDGKFSGSHRDKTQEKSKHLSGHDDRFDKEEDHYGVQLPRRPKPELSETKSNEVKRNI